MPDTRREVLKYLKYRTGHREAIQRIITLLSKRDVRVELCTAADADQLFINGLHQIGLITVSGGLCVDEQLFVLSHEAGHAMEKSSRYARKHFRDYLRQIKIKTVSELAAESKEQAQTMQTDAPCKPMTEIRAIMRREFYADVNQACEARADKFAFRLIRLLMKKRKSIWRQ